MGRKQGMHKRWTKGCEKEQSGMKRPNTESEWKGRRNVKNISLSLARLVHVLL